MTMSDKSQTTRRKPVYRLEAKPGELKAGWGRGDDDDGPDVSAAWQHPAQKGDMNLLLGWLGMMRPPGFDQSFTAELEARGYDLTTLKFSIQKKDAESHG